MMVKQTLSEKCSALGFHADVFTIKISFIWAYMIDLMACSLYKPRGLEPKQLIFCLTLGFDGSNCLLIFRRHTKRNKRQYLVQPGQTIHSADKHQAET